MSSAYTFDALMRRGAIASIRTYQQHFSPRKGFACPHRMLYGESCSDYVKQLLEQQSLRATIKLAPQRFRACKLAASKLQAAHTRQQGGCIVIPCCIPI
jgi:putative component of membrane protein insertase Oxa1/YidC/SpoIIIJ protein YidD